jgi:hypothetical protein
MEKAILKMQMGGVQPLVAPISSFFKTRKIDD